MNPTERKQTDPLEQDMERALTPGRFVHYNGAWSFVENVQGVAKDIGELNVPVIEASMTVNRDSL